MNVGRTNGATLPARAARPDHAATRAETRGPTAHTTEHRADTLAPVTQGLGRVLVVDDDEVIRQLIAVNLTLEGFDVVTAVDGKD